nr:integrase, catalytic region, zinc finger, CCHC-type, peptidase aspartic, catalytic [Tanacetum cinerariifolium]
MFDEYLEPPRIERSISPASAVQAPVNSAGTPSSTTIDQDAPSLKPNSEASSSGDISSTESTYVSQTLHHLNKWSKDHPLNNVIGNPSRPVSTKKQLATDALWARTKSGSCNSLCTPTNKDLEILFQLMFDEYLEPPHVERLVHPAQAVQALVNLADIPSSTTIDQDAPSLSISPSSLALQSYSLHQGIAAESTFTEYNPVAPVDNTPS